MVIGIPAYEGSARSFSSGSSFRGLGGRRILASHEKRKVIHYGPSRYAKWGDVERAGPDTFVFLCFPPSGHNLPSSGHLHLFSALTPRVRPDGRRGES